MTRMRNTTRATQPPARTNAGTDSRYPAWLPWALVALAAIVPYLTALPCGFAYDDGGLILKNPGVDPSHPWWRSLASPYWPAEQQAGLYRPLASLTYRLQRGLAGDAAFPFHLANVLLHAGVALLVLALMRRLAPARPWLSIGVALLFAVHPLHTEAVTNVIGRAEILAAFFGLGGYLLWLTGPVTTRRGLLIGAAFALAAASKESALAWALVACAHRIGLLDDGRGYRRLATAGGAALRRAIVADTAMLAGFALYLAARAFVLGALLLDAPVSLIDNPLHDAAPITRLLTALGLLARGVGLTLVPLRLTADYSFESIRLQTGPAGMGLIALAAAVTLFALAWRARRRRPVYLWAIVLYGALVLPVSNMLLPIGTIFAERLLYLPSLGVIIAAAAAADALALRARRARVAGWLLLAVVLLFAVRAGERNRVWRDDATLFEATAAAQPRSAKARTNLATLRAQTGRWPEAETEYRAALAIYPRYLAALNGLGHAQLMQGRMPEARTIFEQALAAYPQSVETLVRLGNLLLETREAGPALTRFESALALAPRSQDARIGKASALFMLGRYAEAATAWEAAIASSAGGPDLRPHLAAACREAGRTTDAERLWTELMRDHPEAAEYPHALALSRLEHAADGADTSTPAGGPSVVQLARRAAELEPTLTHMETLVRALLARRDCDGARAVLSSSDMERLDPASQSALRVVVREACR
jgi:tetratricopeptide (TPR) repeat protein